MCGTRKRGDKRASGGSCIGWVRGLENLADTRQVYAILDEVFLAGEIEETSKQVVLTRLAHLDKLE